MDCINLQAVFGDRFQIELDESYYAQYGENARTVDPWYMQIPCQHGHICPFGGELLAACTNNRGPVAKKLVDLACTEMWQDGGDGVNVRFHVRDFDQVAKIMKPKRRRRLPPGQRQAAIERLRSYRFTARQNDSGDRRRAQPANRDTLDA